MSQKSNRPGMFLFVGIICFWMNVPAKQLHIFLVRIFFPLGKRWENTIFVNEVVKSQLECFRST